MVAAGFHQAKLVVAQYLICQANGTAEEESSRDAVATVNVASLCGVATILGADF